MLALAVYQPAGAATSPYTDFELISVVPRSPSVKPQLMPIPARTPDQLNSKDAKSSGTGR
jgi:hypothetical protein